MNVIAKDSNVAGFMSSLGAGRRRLDDQPGALHHQACRPQDSQAVGRRRGSRTDPQAGAGARPAGLRAEPAGDQYRRPLGQEPLSVHAARRRHRPALSDGAGDAGQARRPEGTSRRHQRPADQESRGRCRHRPRPGIGGGRDDERGAERALQCVRRAPGLHHLHRQQPVLGADGAAAAVPEGPQRDVADFGHRSQRPARAIDGAGPRHAGRRPAHGQSFRPAAVGHAGVQPGAGSLHRRGGNRRESHRRRRRFPPGSPRRSREPPRRSRTRNRG